ncbi:hypothetical protein MMC18_000794 [Xylographa bjoerkii]|nr:hypothetical protein [Xylographa bjoerkii]
MSFGFGIGDIIAVSDKAWKLYQLCSQSSEQFTELSSQAALLHIVLKQNKENVEKTKLTPEKSSDLVVLIKGCDNVLDALEKLLDKYEAFSTREQSVWNQFKLGLEDTVKLQQKLDTNIGLLTAYNVSLANSSLSRLEKALIKIAKENREAGDGSIFSKETTESTVKSRQVWDRITDQLRNAGVPSQTLTEHADYITAWIIQTAKDGTFENCNPQSNGNRVQENAAPTGIAKVNSNSSINNASLSTSPYPELQHWGTLATIRQNERHSRHDELLQSEWKRKVRIDFGQERVIALFDFEPTRDNELGFHKGDVIVKIESDIIGELENEDESWWKGLFHGRIGIFPSNLVETLPVRTGNVPSYRTTAESSTEQTQTLTNPVLSTNGISPVEEFELMIKDICALKIKVPRVIQQLKLCTKKPFHPVLLQEKFSTVDMTLDVAYAILRPQRYFSDTKGNIWVAVETSIIAAIRVALSTIWQVVDLGSSSIPPPSKFWRSEKFLDLSKFQKLARALAVYISDLCLRLKIIISADPHSLSHLIPRLDEIEEHNGSYLDEEYATSRW